MKIGVFVGSFDPLHKGHINLVNHLLESKIVDRVLIVATMDYPFKSIKTSLIDRLAMLDMIKSENIIIDHQHNQIRYTYELLKTLKTENPHDDFKLVIVSDNYQHFFNWKDSDKILSFGLIVALRDDMSLSDPSLNIEFIKGDFGAISSSLIRSDVYKYRHFLEKRVYEYIIKHGLYINN